MKPIPRLKALALAAATLSLFSGWGGNTVAQPNLSASPSVEIAQADGFSDIQGDTYADEIVRAADIGFVSGFQDQTFRPRNAVTREQAVSMIVESLVRKNAAYANQLSAFSAGTTPFSDVPRNRWSAAKIAFAGSKNLVSGDPGGTFRPTDPVTRAELMAMLRRVADELNQSPTQTAQGFTDTQGHWAAAVIDQMTAICGVASPQNERGGSFAPNIRARRNYTSAALVRLHDCSGRTAQTPQNHSNSPSPNPRTTSSDPFVQELLTAHNRYRSEVNLPDLRWSDTVAASAQRWADQLAATNAFRHSSGSGYGENLWAGTQDAFSLTQMVDSWGNEKRDFILGPFPNVSRTGNWADVGHYTQIVWRDTTEVGCGLATSTQGQDILVCQYNPPGNFRGQKPF